MKHASTIHSRCLSYQELKGYSTKSLDEIEKKRVEQHLSDCSLCRQAIESTVSVNFEELEEDVEEIKQQVSRKIYRIKRAKRNLLISRIAASLLFLLTVTATYFYWNITTYERLFAQYFHAYDIPDTKLRGEEEGQKMPRDLALALENYENGTTKRAFLILSNF